MKDCQRNINIFFFFTTRCAHNNNTNETILKKKKKHKWNKNNFYLDTTPNKIYLDTIVNWKKNKNK